jgi:23S rRNA (guanine745-N1)-methyltransferase
VRHCGRPLERRDRAFTCPAGHSFDISRSGYVNLLQPGDRRSLSPGDSQAAVEARVALERSGVGRAVVEAVLDRVRQLALAAGAVVVDLGSGSGEMLGSLSTVSSVSCVGIDLSVAAIKRAARRFPALTWVVANADRRLPLQDDCIDLVLSIHARRNPAECARVLTVNGYVLVVLPAPDDLMELRALVQGQAIERDRAETVLAEHATHFELIERFPVRERRQLDRDVLVNLLQGTYRGARFTSASRVDRMEAMTVTLSSEVCVLKRSG